MEKPHIIIAGSGFGGVYVARQLAPYVKRGLIDVTIISRTNYFLFTPMLHEVATGGLTPTSVTEPLREIFAGKGIRICVGEVKGINPSAKTVQVDETHLSYDYLVLATGAESNDFGTPGADIYSYPLKTLMDAIRVRTAIIRAFEKMAVKPDGSAGASVLSFAVIGSGATGVETAAELVEFAHSISKRYFPSKKDFRSPEVSVTLIGSAPEVLMQFDPVLRQDALEILGKKGVKVRLGARVTSVQATHIDFADGSTLPTDVVIWAAGVKPSTPPMQGEHKLEFQSGRVKVEATLRAMGDKSIFALGDAAAAMSESGELMPMLAQVAVGQAKIVAKNLRASIDGRALSTFVYASKGNLVSLGQWRAIGKVFKTHINGRFAWWMWRTIYLFKFFSWKKRIRIAFEWTLDLFYPRDITQIP